MSLLLSGSMFCQVTVPGKSSLFVISFKWSRSLFLQRFPLYSSLGVMAYFPQSSFMFFLFSSPRVGALAWNGDMLSSGSRDRFILQRDVRTPRFLPDPNYLCKPLKKHPNLCNCPILTESLPSSVLPERRLTGHRQEVCGLKWSPDGQYLARWQYFKIFWAEISFYVQRWKYFEQK